MNKQSGSTLVVALVLLLIITLVAAYTLEGSGIQSKMVANTLFSSITYQECRNEQESNVRFFNINNGAQRETLLNLVNQPILTDPNTGEKIHPTIEIDSLTQQHADFTPQSDSINVSWSYIRPAPNAVGGYDIDIAAPVKFFLFENLCESQFRFSQNSQTLGATAQGLAQAGDLN